VRLARARAARRDRDSAAPDDVKAVAGPTLAHRLVLRSEAWVRGVTASEVVAEVLGGVPVPEALTAADRASVTATG